MSVLLVFGAIIGAVFAIAFVSSRRFGPLALALAAGAVLADIWSEWLAIIIGGFGVAVPGLPHGVIATLIILLAPLFLLLFGGPRYQGKYERIMSAVLIALLTAALLVRSLGRYLVLDGDALKMYQLLYEWWQVVVTAGLLLGLIDLFLLHSAPAAHGKKKH